MKLAIASDHAGFSLKEKIKNYLLKKYQVIDLGTNSEDSVDYPSFGFSLGNYIKEKKADLGIAICGTGIGISIACNKVEGIRAALITDIKTAELAKVHNNANIICFGGRTNSFNRAKKMVDTFLAAKFELRHQKRLDLIEKFEKGEN